MHARGNCAHSAGCMSIERACTTFVGAGLLAKAACQARTMSDGPTSSRASALLQWNGVHPVRTTSAGDGFHRTCRSRLAGEGGVSGDDDVGWADVFAGKRAPTMDGVHPAGSCSIGGMHASGNCVHSAGLHFDRAGLHHIRRSRLAGEGGVSGDDDVGWAGVFAGERSCNGNAGIQTGLQHSYTPALTRNPGAKKNAVPRSGTALCAGVLSAEQPVTQQRQHDNRQHRPQDPVSLGVGAFELLHLAAEAVAEPF